MVALIVGYPALRLRGHYLAMATLAIGLIASNVGGLADLVRDGRTGYLVPDGDATALAAKLLPLLGDPELRATLGAHGVATAEAYSWAAVAEQVDDLYERLSAEYAPA